MTGTFPIATSILGSQNTVPYKYIVYSPKTEEDKDCYEKLHDFSGVVNRALVLSPQQFSTCYGG